MIETRRITIDIDLTRNRRKLLDQLAIVQRLLNNLKPCQARVSSSKRGLHVQKFYDKILYDYEGWEIYEKHCHPLIWCEEIYDDPKRKKIRVIRAKDGSIPNILFDEKSYRGIIRKAGEWHEIQNALDVELLLDFFLDFWRP